MASCPLDDAVSFGRHGFLLPQQPSSQIVISQLLSFSTF